MRNQAQRKREHHGTRGRVRVETALVPYCRLEHGWTVAPSAISDFYWELADDGVLEQVYLRPVSEHDFIAYFQQPGNFPLFLFDAVGICTVAWLNNVEHRSAFCHHGSVRRVWGAMMPIATKVLDYWFSLADAEGPLLDVLVGITPARLRLARAFAKRLGFTFLQPAIPRMQGEGVHVSYLERERWAEVKAAGAAAGEATPAQSVSPASLPT